eukprot:Skav215797  [mRNA]  locus=scaffold3885:52289:52510:- [translate_table: standard]
MIALQFISEYLFSSCRFAQGVAFLNFCVPSLVEQICSSTFGMSGRSFLVSFLLGFLVLSWYVLVNSVAVWGLP